MNTVQCIVCIVYYALHSVNSVYLFAYKKSANLFKTRTLLILSYINLHFFFFPKALNNSFLMFVHFQKNKFQILIINADLLSIL